MGDWTQDADGTVVTVPLVPLPASTEAAIAGLASTISNLLDGTVIIPMFRTPPERRMAAAAR